MDELLGFAEAATSEDPKISRLISEVENIRAEEPGANIIIFTEYTDSQSAVIKALDDAKSLKGKILSICGDDPFIRPMISVRTWFWIGSVAAAVGAWPPAGVAGVEAVRG